LKRRGFSSAVPPNTCDSGRSALGILGGAALSALRRASQYRRKPYHGSVEYRGRAALQRRVSSKTKRALAPARGNHIHTHNLCLLGFGNVNRTLVQLLLDRKEELRDRHGISFRITGIASRRLGWIANPDGLNVERAPSPADDRESNQKPANVRDWLQAAQADILFEATSLNVETGQPAIDHIRAALHHGAHAITANKGPIVHAYRELRDLAASKNKRFLFESTVMDGVPIFSFFDQLPAIHLQGFHGILNSTTNVILTEMENGLSFEEALKKAQSLGIAETDATHDIDGYDAAVKTAALITVLMDIPIKLEEIERKGIRNLNAEAVRAAKKEGKPYKLICRAKKTGDKTEQRIEASVRPEQIPQSNPMSQITGTSSYIHFETDIFPGLALTEENPGLYATAYGMLADFVRAVTK
jgi:homoserine dehydrogenase